MGSRLTCRMALGAVLSILVLLPISAKAAPSCGNGVVDPSEECDGGGQLYCATAGDRLTIRLPLA